MSRNTRRSRRRSAALQRSQRNTWLRRYYKALRNGVAAASIGAIGLCAQPAHAVNNSWIGNNSVNWLDAANWSTNPLGPATGDTLEFLSAGTAGAILNDNLMTTSSYSISGLTYDIGAAAFTINPNTAGFNGFTVGVGTGILNNSTNLQTINDNIAFSGTRTVTTSAGGGNLTFGGALSGSGGMIKSGAGTLTLNGTIDYAGTTEIQAGTVNINNAMGGTRVVGALTFGSTSGQSAIVNISSNITTNSATTIGGVTGGTVANASGAVYQTGGNFISNLPGGVNAFQIGAGGSVATPGAYGYYNLSGGTLKVNEIGIGGGNANNVGATGIMDVTGGTFTSTAWITIGRGGLVATSPGQIASLNVSGATAKVFSGGAAGSDGPAGEFGMNWGGTGAVSQLNISNNGLVDTNNTRVRLNEGAAGTNNLTVINLASGGTLRTQRLRAIATGGYTPIVNFDGGILKASVNNPAVAFISESGGPTMHVYVNAGGGTIDNSGFSTIPIVTPFEAPTGSGVTAIALATPGAGYIGPPGVSITGGSGIGATGIATVNPATGQVTGITITNHGTGYAPADVLTVTLSGGGSTSAATIGTITLGTNTSGGMTFIGSGTTTLNGTVNTYTGATNIQGGGTLALTGAASINTSSQINVGTVASSGKLLQNSSAAITQPIVISNGGSVSGTGTVNSITVSDGASNALTSSNVNTTALTAGNVTFNGAGALNLTTSAGTNTTVALTTSTLTTGAVNIPGKVSINATNSGGIWTAGTYDLVGYTSLAGQGFADIQKGLIAGVGGRQTASLTNNTGSSRVQLTIAGESPVWSGIVSNAWTTNVIPPDGGGNKNWTVSTGATDYQEVASVGDAVQFTDAGTNTAVNISSASVSPAAMVFSANQAYSVSSTGGFGITGGGFLLKTGGGDLTLNTANSYSGGTTISAGKLNLGNASAIGTGNLTIGLGTTLDNTSGADMTLTGNNKQTWTGDFTFVGTKNLNMGTGTVTAIANAGNTVAGRTRVTVGTTASNTLTIGGAINTDGGLDKAGPGILVLKGGGSIAGQSTLISGKLIIDGGTNTLSMTNTTAPTLGAGQGSGDNNTIFVNSGTLNTGSEIWLGSNSNAYGSLTVNNGNVNVGSWLALGRATGGGAAPAGVGLVNLYGGKITVQQNNITIGSFGVAGSTGTGQITVTGGTLATTGNTGLFVGENFPGYLNVSGAGQVVIDPASGNGTIVGVNGGATNSVLNIGAVGTGGGTLTTPRLVGGTGVIRIVDFHGGTVKPNINNNGFMSATFTRAVVWGEGATIDTNGFNIGVAQVLSAPFGNGVTLGTLAVSGGNYADTPFVQVTRDPSDTTGTGATAVATIDYNTGNLTGIVITNPGTGYTAPPAFTLVGGGPGNTGALTGAAGLAANNTTGGLTKAGAGTLALTAVNTYNGATTLTGGTLAINGVNVLGNGALTIGAAGVTIDNTTNAAITMTGANPQNWNNDFNFGGTQSLKMIGNITLGGAAGSRTITTSGTTATLTEGGVIANGTATGLTKAGPGTLALSGTNTYTGPTSIIGGTLQLSSDPGSINTTSGITVNGAGARLLQMSPTNVTPIVTLTKGSVDGTTTINTVQVGNGTGGVVTHGNGTTSPLAIGTLTFAGAGNINVLTSPATAASTKINVTSLTTNAAGLVTIGGTSTTGLWSPGTYQLVSYGGGAINGGGFGQIQVGTFASLGARQSATLQNNANSHIDVLIGGNQAIWTGAQDANWDTSTTAHNPSKDWKLSVAGTATDYVSGDSVIMDDTATGSTTINLAENVAPANISFNNLNKSYSISSSGAFRITGGAVFINGGGSVTLTTPNTYFGGTTLNSGTLNINNASAIGSGSFTLNGGTIDNTTAANITYGTTIQLRYNGNFTVNGTKDLNFGTSPVTLLGNSGVNVAAGTFTTGAINGTGDLTKSGVGTMTVNSANAASNISGTLTVSGGKVQISVPAATTVNSFTVGGLAGSGTVENSANATNTLIINGSTNNTFSGVLQDGAPGTGRLGLTKNGTGTQTLSGANTISDTIAVNSGKLVLTGSNIPALPANATNGLAINTIIVGTSAAAVNGIFDIQGRLDALRSPTHANAPSIQVGAGAGTAGALRVGAGAQITSADEIWLATGEGGYGVMDMSGGTVNTGSWLPLGRGGGQGVINQSGGTITVAGNPLSIGSFGGAIDPGTVHALINLSGGTLQTPATSFYVGEGTAGVVNVSGTGHVIAGPNGIQIALGNFYSPANGSMVNLLGGTVTTPQINQGAGAGLINFNGGTLQATIPNAAFLTSANGTGTLNAFVFPGGAKIDSNGVDIQIDQNLAAPTGNGVGLGTLSASGSGFIGTPVVQITRGVGDTTGTGATANAVIDSNGNLTGIVITNPGTDYTAVPTFTLVGGGIGNTGSLTGAASIVSNTSGGLTKLGLGQLTITAGNTYTGPTTVSQGTLYAVSGTINNTSKLILSGGTFRSGGTDQILTSAPLQVTASSIIDQNGGGTLHFADSSNTVSNPWGASSPGSILRINNWLSGTSHILLDGTGLTAGELNQIHFTGFKGTAKLVANELLPNTNIVLTRGDITVDSPTPIFNSADLAAMESALTDLPSYESLHGFNDADVLDVADVNRDGLFNNADIQAEISFLITGTLPAPLPSAAPGGTVPVPEPTGVILLGIGGVIYLLRRNRS